MKKFALVAGVGLLALGSIGTAEAQRFDRDGLRDGGRWNRTTYRTTVRHHNYGYNTGGAVAAGFVGGALLGGLATAAASPYYGYGYPAASYGYGYGYPAASYGYPAAGYGYGSYPVASYGYDAGYGYYGAPAYRTRVVYRQPTARTRVVYRDRPAVRSTRVVYRQPRARIVAQPAYDTRVSYRQAQRDRTVIRSNVRRDVGATGSVDRREQRMERRMMRD